MRPSLTAFEAVISTSRLVLLGDPGSGKSTFVRYLTILIANAALEGRELPSGLGPKIIPVLIIVRDLASCLAELDLNGISKSEQNNRILAGMRKYFLSYLEKFDLMNCAAVIDHAFVTGQVLLIFDGLDEVVDELRNRIKQAVEIFLQVYPKVRRVIVTSRVISYVGAGVLPGFTVHTLAPFDENKVGLFINKWYEALSETGQMDKYQAASRAKNLLNSVLSPGLIQLAQNPLLLTTIFVAHYRNAGLPKEIVQIYSTSLDVLLSRLQPQQELNLTKRLHEFLSDRWKLRRILARLAFEAQHFQLNQGKSLTKAYLLNLLVKEKYFDGDELASEFLDFISKQSGLLVSREGKGNQVMYSFIHLSFQEYLAACYIASLRNIAQKLWQMVEGGEYWSIVIQLTVEEMFYNSRRILEVLDLAYTLCPISIPQEEAQWRATLWSGRIAAMLGRREIWRNAEGGRAYLERLIPRLKQIQKQTILSPKEQQEVQQLLDTLVDENYQLSDTAQIFFEFAGFKIVPINEENIFICQPKDRNWQTKFFQPIPLVVETGNPLDSHRVLNISASLSRIFGDTLPVIFVIINRAPTDDGWLQIATLRAKNIQVIPIDDAVLFKGQEEGRQRQTLEKHLRRFTGPDRDLYNVRDPVADRLNFFGREVLAAEMLEDLNEGRPLAVFGLRKMGKSSLLNYLRDRLTFPTALVDLQTGTELTDLYQRILNSWGSSLRVKLKDLTWSPPKLSGASNSSVAFSAAARELLDRLEEQSLLPRLGIMVDEADVVFPQDKHGIENYLSFSRMLRGLVQEEDRISLIIAGVDPSLNRTNRIEGQQNPLYQFFREMYLPALNFEDCKQMIRNIGRQMGLVYSDEAVSFVAMIAGGHPFLARQLCSLAFRQLEGPGEVPLEHLQQVTIRFIREPGTAELLDEKGLWGEVVDPHIWPQSQIIENERVLSTLAQIEPQPEATLVSHAQNRRACERSLDELERRAVLGKPEIDSFDINLRLFRNWIRRYKLGEV